MRELSEVEGDLRAYDDFARRLEDLETLDELAVEEGDDEAASEVVDQLASLRADLDDLEVLVLLSGEHDGRSAVVQIQAGAGGTDSQDWAHMLERMLLGWAERRGFDVEVHEEQGGDEAGIRSATFTVRGTRAYGLLKAEHGVHRLVRISPFDSQSRRHTAFAAVEVVPELDDVDDAVEVADEEVRVDVFRASGPGGQGVNTTDSAVRITHLETGIVVACQNERSQLQNKATAMWLLRAKLAERRRAERARELDELRGEQHDVAWGSQIRSYVLHPYQMVKDHRTDLEVGDVDKVLAGDLDPFITAWLQQRARATAGPTA